MWKWLNKWKRTAYSTAVQSIIYCAVPFIDDVLHTKSIKLGCLNKLVKAILIYTESTNTETACWCSFSPAHSLRSGAGGDCSLGWLCVAVFWNLKINEIAAKTKTPEECNLQQNKVRCLIVCSDMANEEKAFSFHICFHFVIVISRVISREICIFVLPQRMSVRALWGLKGQSKNSFFLTLYKSISLYASNKLCEYCIWLCN